MEKRSINRCAAKLCVNNSNNSDYSFFKFPTDKSRSSVWAVACHRDDLLAKPDLHSLSFRVCGVHFENRMFANSTRNRLKKDAVPSIFPALEGTSSSAPLDATKQLSHVKMEITFTGKRILVTGAGQGIGRGIAKHLAENGAKVVAVGRTKSHLESLKAEHPNVEIITVDLGNWDETKEVLKNLGHVDGLVNNAAVAQLAAFFEIKPEEFDTTFAVNVKSIINVSQIVAKEWVDNKTGGSIVNISSQAALAALQDHTVYCASKSAVDAITRNMALELGPHNIRVNSVNPTVIMTDMGKIGWSDPKKAGPMMAKIPLKRFGEVEEVVHAVLYLLSEKSSMINGVALPIDGGFLAT